MRVPAAAVAGFLLAACGDGPREPARIVVAVAASVRAPAEEAAARFGEERGTIVEITGGATGVLAAQARAGAPFDLFLAADAEIPAALAGEGILDARSVRTYARGRLVLWSADGAVAAEDLRGEAWKSKRIAIANPDTAPYGRAAMDWLECAGLAEDLRSALVPASDVRAAFEIARSGNVDAALVAEAVVGDAPFAELACDGKPVAVDHALGIVASSRRPDEARRFADYLLGDEGQAIFAANGLDPVAAATP